MTQPPDDEPTATSTEELREQVEQTRHELGDTVQALADKADVKARAQTTTRAAELTGQANEKTKAPEPMRNHRTALTSAGAAFLAVFVLLRRKKK
ncbi:DUF3618 domain-containing protein [Streptomyces sp. NPDC051576]|uniref:DUF3618 domain-containing protein n=1 Tax=Streptomyces sp. NPDC051576 TaxID=3155803 RepID=UPI00343C6E6C